MLLFEYKSVCMWVSVGVCVCVRVQIAADPCAIIRVQAHVCTCVSVSVWAWVCVSVHVYICLYSLSTHCPSAYLPVCQSIYQCEHLMRECMFVCAYLHVYNLTNMYHMFTSGCCSHRNGYLLHLIKISPQGKFRLIMRLLMQLCQYYQSALNVYN